MHVTHTTMGAPAATRFAYVYAVALHDAGDRTRATAVLEEAHRRRPANREVLVARVTYLREKGSVPAALRYATALADLAPGDRDLQRPVESLQRTPSAPR